jgi:hypothetical protein
MTAAVEVVCGTEPGYHKHRRQNTDPCAPCRRAHADYHREWRAKTGKMRTATIRFPLLGALLAEASAEVLAEVERELGRWAVAFALEQHAADVAVLGGGPGD